jgi:hypothetical protein
MTTRILALSVILATGAMLAAGDYAVDWLTVDGGAQISSTGSGYDLWGTIGQPDASAAGALTGGGYELTGGFWVPAALTCTSFAPADFNHDCSVDHSDAAIFEACATGPGIPQPDPACAKARLDGDDDVDQSDFAILQRCYSGQNVPADPNCGD